MNYVLKSLNWEDKNILSNFSSTEILEDELLLKIKDYMKE